MSTIDGDGMIGLLQRLLAIPSPQTDLLEAEPQVVALIRDVLLPEAEALSPGWLTLDTMGNMAAAWGPPPFELALLVYAMTHPPTVMPDPYEPRIVDGQSAGLPGLCVRGRGACEQKGAMAAAFAAARAVTRETRLSRGFALIALTAGETGRPDAIAHLLDETALPVRRAIVACGTGNAICLGQKGRLDVDIVVRGKQSHSSTPWLGLNAVEGAAEVLKRVQAHKVLGEHPKLGAITLTPTAVSTLPKATHTVPEEARITVDRRVGPGEDPAAVLDGLRAIVGEVPPFTVTLVPGAFMHPYEVGSEDTLPRWLRQSFERVLGRPPAYSYSSGGLDAGYLNGRGIEALMFGPGDLRLAHTADDLVSIQECADAASVYAYSIRRACLETPL